MKNWNGIIGLLLLTVLATSCGPNLTPFTQRLYDQQAWTQDDLKEIQFYLSEDIVLKRQAREGRSRITDGGIRIVDDGKIDKVTIRRGTPGVFVFSPKDNRFAISFDKNDDLYLMFGTNPKASNRYTLLASEWRNRVGTVSYGEKQYKIDTRAAYAALMVDLKRTRRVSTRSRTAGGRKIN